VFVVGGGFGEDFGGMPAEIYTPWTNRWTLAAPTLQPEVFSTATLLSSGKVLVVGGGVLCEQPTIYTPWTDSWTFAPPPPDSIFPCQGHVAVRLLNGRVLFHGGLNNQGVGFTGSWEFRPFIGTWYPVPDSPIRQSEGLFGMVLLRSGRVLLVGGSCRLCVGGSRETWLYDPRTSSWSRTGDVAYWRGVVALAPLPSGGALVAGYGAVTESGGEPGDNPRSAEVYDPVTGTWSQVADSHVPVGWAATSLQNGAVLIVGGQPPQLFVGAT
jgi:hypothetical protein